MFGNRTPLAISISNMSCNVYYYEHILIERHGDEGGEVLGSRSEVLSTDARPPSIYFYSPVVCVGRYDMAKNKNNRLSQTYRPFLPHLLPLLHIHDMNPTFPCVQLGYV